MPSTQIIRRTPYLALQAASHGGALSDSIIIGAIDVSLARLFGFGLRESPSRFTSSQHFCPNINCSSPFSSEESIGRRHHGSQRAASPRRARPLRQRGSGTGKSSFPHSTLYYSIYYSTRGKQAAEMTCHSLVVRCCCCCLLDLAMSLKHSNNSPI